MIANTMLCFIACFNILNLYRILVVFLSRVNCECLDHSRRGEALWASHYLNHSHGSKTTICWAFIARIHHIWAFVHEFIWIPYNSHIFYFASSTLRECIKVGFVVTTIFFIFFIKWSTIMHVELLFVSANYYLNHIIRKFNFIVLL